MAACELGKSSRKRNGDDNYCRRPYTHILFHYVCKAVGSILFTA